WDEETETASWRRVDPAHLSVPTALPIPPIDCRAAMLGDALRAPWMLFWGCNYSVRRDDLLAVGGYDERFRGWGWEDLELGYRLHRLRLRLHFDTGAWCVHYPHARKPLLTRLK